MASPVANADEANRSLAQFACLHANPKPWLAGLHLHLGTVSFASYSLDQFLIDQFLIDRFLNTPISE